MSHFVRGARLFRAVLALICLLASAAPSAAQYFGQNKVQYDKFDFAVLKTEHFDVYYYPIEEEAARLTARMAERWYERLSTLLEHQLSTRQPLILYASHPEFEQTNVIEGLISEATGGVTEGGRRRVVMPLAATLDDTDHVLGHELVHAFQYDILGPNINQAPLWFIEGMAEYLSIGPRHPQTAMWLRDAALEGTLPTIRDLDNPRFFPYRFGHAFWAFVGGKWGDAAVASILHRLSPDAGGVGPVRAIELTTELEDKELSEQWHAAIHELYGITPRDRTAETREPESLPNALLSRRSGSGGLNIGPSLSPDGRHIAFLSERSQLAIDLHVADTDSATHVRRLTTTAVDPHFESLQFLASAGSWAPDNRRLAIASVQRGRGAIAIIDTHTSSILQNIQLEERGEIFHPAWSPDGESIAFVAQIGGFTDLFVHTLSDGRTRRLTTDPYADLQPTWSPDGRRLLFVTDRYTTNLETLAFSDVGLATLDVQTGQITEVKTGLNGQAASPQWSADGASIIFVSDHAGRPDVYRLTLATGQAVPLTAEPTGVSGITPLSPALSVARTTGQTAYTVFREGNYEIRLLDANATSVAPVGASTNLAQLPPSARASDVVARQLAQPTIGLPPATQSFETGGYSSGLHLVGLGQEYGATTGGLGTYVSGGISMLFSDILGNHLVPLTLGVEGRPRDVGAQSGYINRTSRWNWGVSGGHVPLLNGYVDSGFTVIDGQDVYVERRLLLREMTTYGGGMVAYPFSRSTRMEFGASARRIGFSSEQELFVYNALNGQFLFRERQDGPGAPALALMDTSAALIRDRAAFGAVSPVLGQRFRFEIAPTFGDLRMTTATLDLRQYVMPVRPVTFAVRALHMARYGSGGEDSRLYPLYIAHSQLVRGYDASSFDINDCTPAPDGSCPELDRLVGSRIAVLNAEARVPIAGLFTGNLDYGPIPAELFGFYDGGTAWSRGGQQLGEGLRPWVSSVGFGTRVNIFGFAVVELNLARPIDRLSKGWRFVFNLRPGF